MIRIAAAYAAVLCACVAFAPPARADSLLAAPSDKFVISPGGVDMRSGRYAYTHTDLSIGGAGGLELSRTMNQQVLGHTNPFANFSHNSDMMVVETRVNINQGNFRNGSGLDYQIQVAFGGLSQTFRTPGTAGLGYQLASTANYGALSYSSGDTALDSTVYTYQDSSGDTAVFRPIGSGDCSSTVRCAYVSQLTRADGTVLNFQYATDGTTNSTRLVSITSSRGYALLFEYSGMQIVKACALNVAVTVLPANNLCPAGVLSASYSYDSAAGEQRLSSVTDPSGAVWAFVNAAGSIGFENPGDGTPWLTNHIHKRFDDDNVGYDIVDSQSFADGRSYSYAYDLSPFILNHQSVIAGGGFVDGQGRQTNVSYDFPKRPSSPAPGQTCTKFPCSPYDVGDEVDNTVFQMTPGPVSVTDPLNHTTIHDYCDPNAEQNLPSNEVNRCLVQPAPVSTTDPGSITTNLTWDFSTNHLLQSDEVARWGSSLPDIIRSASYNCTPTTMRSCDKPTSYTDANGNTTNYTYAPEHGGVLSEMQPPPSSGAARPLKLTTWVQKFAYYKNSSGVLAAAPTPVFVIASETECQTVAGANNNSAVCDGAAPQRVTTYQYGADGTANNLNVRGIVVTADGTSRRTCYSYDNLGNRISQTSARAGLTTCP